MTSVVQERAHRAGHADGGEKTGTQGLEMMVVVQKHAHRAGYDACGEKQAHRAGNDACGAKTWTRGWTRWMWWGDHGHRADPCADRYHCHTY